MMEPVLSPEIRKLAEHQAILCKVFSSAQRILILWLLAEKEQTVTEIASALGASLPGTSQHLRLMELNNIVESRRMHHNIVYQVAKNDLLNHCLVLLNRPKIQQLEVKTHL